MKILQSAPDSAFDAIDGIDQIPKEIRSLAAFKNFLISIRTVAKTHWYTGKIELQMEESDKFDGEPKVINAYSWTKSNLDIDGDGEKDESKRVIIGTYLLSSGRGLVLGYLSNDGLFLEVAAKPIVAGAAVRLFLTLDGPMNANAELYMLRLVAKAQRDLQAESPTTKLVLVSDSQPVRSLFAKIAGVVTSDIIDGEFDRSIMISDKAPGEIVSAVDRYDFPVKVIRIHSGQLHLPAEVKVRPDESIQTPKGPVQMPSFADRYSDFVDVLEYPPRQWIPLTLTPDFPLPPTWDQTQINGY